MTSEQTKIFVSRCSKLLKNLNATNDRGLVLEITELKTKMQTHLKAGYWQSCKRSYARENDLAYCERQLTSLLSRSKLPETASKQSCQSYDSFSNARTTNARSISSFFKKFKLQTKLNVTKISTVQSELLSKNSTGAASERRSLDLASFPTSNALSVTIKPSSPSDSATISETPRRRCIRRKLQPMASTSTLSLPLPGTSIKSVSISFKTPNKAYEAVTRRENMKNERSSRHASPRNTSTLGSLNKPLPRLPESGLPSVGPGPYFVEIPESRRTSAIASRSSHSSSSSCKTALYSPSPLIPLRKLTLEELTEYSAKMEARAIAFRNQARVHSANRKKERWETFKNVRVTVRY